MINKIDIASKNWAEDYITQHGSRFINMLREAFIAGFKKGVFCSKPKWIPVSERLPEESVEVLVCSDNGDIEVADCYYSTEIEGMTVWLTSGWRFGKVIAWMPLPEPYKREEE